MDQGVIKATKAYYHASVVRRYIDAVEKGKGAPNISVLDAMTILTRAWNKVTPETIKNCFKKAGICSEAQTIAINYNYNFYITNPVLVMTNLDRKSQKFKAENDFVKRKHLEGSYVVCELRAA